MLFVTAVLLPLVASLAVAQHGAHGGHENLHEKREVVWTTEVDYVTQTVDITTTIWVDAYATPSTSSSISASVNTTRMATTFTTLTSSSQQQAAEFHQETPSVVPPPPAPPAPSSSVYVAPPPPPAPAAAVVSPPDTPPPAPPAVSSAAPPPAPPAVSSAAPVPAPPAPPAVSSAAPAPAPAPPPAVAPPPASGGASSGGPCSSGSPCSGDITFYEAGLGACGEDSDGTAKNVIALPFGLMGTQSNGNPYCFKTVTITKGSTSITATVVDKCMGCVDDAIDLSHAAWTALGLDYGLGRTQATWFFN